MGRPKNMTELNEFLAQLGVVVYLSVKDHSDCSILVPHRLMAAGNVNDGQAPMAEMDPKLLINPKAFSVRPAMGEPLRHPFKQDLVDGPDETD
jgi:hypothetical protein